MSCESQNKALVSLVEVSGIFHFSVEKIALWRERQREQLRLRTAECMPRSEVEKLGNKPQDKVTSHN